VRDAFAPVGLCIDFWKDKVVHQTQSRVPLMLINDLEQPWHGAVTLRLRKAGNTSPVSEVKLQASLESFGQATLEFPISWPDALGQYTLEAELRGADGQPVRSVRELEIIDARALGLAYQKPVTASSSHAKEYLPANAVDGDPGTYWSSTFADPAWLAVNLGEVHKIRQVRITWENAYSKEFAVQISRDGQNWTDAFKQTNGKGGVSEIQVPGIEAQHVRISCTKRGTQWGHAIRELEVFE
jgi:hypothetical protein